MLRHYLASVHAKENHSAVTEVFSSISEKPIIDCSADFEQDSNKRSGFYRLLLKAAMTTTAGVTPIRCRNIGTPEEIRARARCFVGVGIVLIIIGIALLCVSFATLTFIIGPSIVIVIWGIMCLLIGWRRFQLAGMVENNATNVPTATISGNLTTTSHPPVTVFQQSTTTVGNNYGFQPAQYSNVYPEQSANTNSAYAPEAPPYSSYNMYSTPTAPPSYNDAVKTPS